MSLATRVSAKVAQAVLKVGQAATLVVPTATIATSGAVTETTTSTAVQVAGPIIETRRYAAEGSDSRVSATFYLPAEGLTVTPTQTSRIVIGARKWQVVSVATDSISGVVVNYRLDCGEVAGD